MKNIKIIPILLTMWCSMLFAFADGDPVVQIPEFPYKSPEALSFQRYGEYSVGEYSGNPQISLPLYTVKYKDIEVPISLAYQGGGIKVQDEATWVGLGWNLSPGGCINLIPAGKVDALQVRNTPLSNFSGLLNSNPAPYFMTNNNNCNINTGFFEDIKTLGERDFYHVNVAGKNLLFYIDPGDNTPIVIGSDEEIYKINMLNMGWQIVDAQGYIYYFNSQEKAATTNGALYTSAWYLDRIESPAGNNIYFGYTQELPIYLQTKIYEQYDVSLHSEILHIYGYYENGVYKPATVSYAIYPQGLTSHLTLDGWTTQKRYLTSISTNDQQINFHLGSRTDIEGQSRRLDSITVKSLVSNKTIKTIHFMYDYFHSNSIGGDYLVEKNVCDTTTHYASKRLKLEAIEIRGGQESPERYSFAYDETNGFPCKTSYAIDMWGYYNGHENSAEITGAVTHTFVPKATHCFIGNNADTAFYDRIMNLKGANRFSDSRYVGALSLTKIVYPTKGYTKFTYEPHRFFANIIYPDANSSLANGLTYQVQDINYTGSYGGPTIQQQLTLDCDYKGSLEVTFLGGQKTLAQLQSSGTSVTLMRIDQPNHNPTYTINLIGYPGNLSQNYSWTTSEYVYLPAGNYIFIANLPDNIGSSYGSSVKGVLNLTAAISNPQTVESTGGGIRVKSIENYDSNDNLLEKTDYEYLDSLGNTSGKFIKPESLSKIKDIYYFYNPDPRWIGWDETLYRILQLTSVPTGVGTFPSYTSGNTVGYSRVIKKTYTNKGTRREIKTFSNHELHWDLPGSCVVSVSDNGNLLTQVIWNEEEALMKKTLNNYSTFERNDKINVIIEPTTYGNQGLVPDHNQLNHKTFDIKCFSYKNFWSRLVSSTVTDYIDGVASQEKTINYSYDSVNKTLTQTEESTSISNLRIRNKMQYSTDFSDATSLGMVNKNMINVPVLQSKILYNTTSGSETLQYSKKVTYGDNWGGSGYFLPRKESFAFGSGNMEDRLVYRYNNDGNLIEVIKDSQPGVVYLWAYSGQYPVAKIEGVTYDTVQTAYTLNKINTLYNKTSNLESSFTELRNSLASLGCLITTYTYEPLLGITSITEPNGTKTTYKYDGMGRLSCVLDNNDDTISVHNYHFASIDDPDDHNFTRSTVKLDSLGISSLMSMNFYDDLGRPSQKISSGVSPGLFHNTYQTYDMSGRVSESWLPIAADEPDYIYQDDIVSQSQNTYHDSYAFSSTDYDALDRPLFFTTPGGAWATGNRGKTVLHTTNTASSVKKYTLQNGGLTDSGYYAAGTLSCETHTDEDSIRSQCYKDAQGRIILERKTAAAGNNLDTYYIYNNYGQLSIVLSPMYQEEASISKHAYQYTYDSRGRVREKTLPGCSYVKYGYNTTDQLVYMQDGMMRENGSKYRFLLYDALGRMVIQGTCSNEPTTLANTITTMIPATGSSSYLSTGYTRSTTPTLTGAKVEVVNYYDTYSFLPLYSSELGSAIISKMTKSNPLSAKGLLTGTMQKASNGETLLEVFYYDTKGQVINTYCLTLNKKLTATYFTYNFVGDIILDKKEYYTWTGSALSKILTAESTKSYYDSTRLLKRTILKMTDSSNHVVRDTMRFEYDSLGHISSLDRYGNAADMSYQYDLVHGWLTGVSSKGGFVQNLIRESHPSNPLFNGNISAMTWQIPDDSFVRRYDFTYDEINRLTEGKYSHLPALPPPILIQTTGDAPLALGELEDEPLPINLIPNTGGNLGNLLNPYATDRYTERIAYDRNSNITCIERYGMNNLHQYGMIDSLVITRNGNQLKTIEDYAEKHLTYTGASDFYDGYTYNNEYGYNANGALESDINRDIDLIQYDDLGNTRCIYYFEHDQIEYIYAADGTKLRTIHKPASSSALTDSTDYIGNLILKNGQPSMYLFDGGFVAFNSNGAISSSGMHYYIQDYLGNNRMVVNRNGIKEQVTHYYPYGGVIGDISTNENVQKYKFEGKELDRTFGLDNYDIHARQYFAMMPSWDRIDPLAEKYYGISPYAFCGGDPVNKWDLDGEKFDYSNMTDEQSKMYFETVDVAKEESSIFNKLYTLMEESPQVVYIRFGETTGEGNGGVPVPAQYASLGSNESEIVINQNSSSITVGAIAEEIMHAYQYENNNNYDGLFNFEFEAKVLKAAIACQMGGTMFFDDISFLKEIKMGGYSNSSLPIDLDNTSFLEDYLIAANEYSTYNTNNNIGNSHYKVETKVKPYCLIKLIKP